MQSRRQLKILIVDDSTVVRALLGKILTESGYLVAATAKDGYEAIGQLKSIPIDVILLDVEMPKMNGLEALPHLKKIDPKVTVLMLSSLTQKGAQVSMQALQLGAADFIPKPSAAQSASGLSELKHQLIGLLDAYGQQKSKAQPQSRSIASPPATPSKLKTRPAAAKPIAKASDQSISKSPTASAQTGSSAVRLRQSRLPSTPSCILVGSSTGGPNALSEFFKSLSPEIGLPVFVTQHMPPLFTKTLADRLNKESDWKCYEAQAGMVAEAGTIYVAPGGLHMTLTKEAGKTIIQTNENPPVNYCRPSVDVLFESAISHFGSSIIAVILTGMGSDGLNGSKQIAEAGGCIYAQDQETSVVWGMPGAVVKAQLANGVFALNELGHKVQVLCRKRVTQ